jgi:hypothetical protein
MMRVAYDNVPFPLPSASLHLNQGEGVLNRARLPDGFPESDRPIRRKHNLTTAVGPWPLMRETKVIGQ